MIASIITAVAIALMSVAIFLLSARVKEVESDTEDITKVKKALQAQQRFIRDIEEDLTKCEEKAVYADGSIETIFKKLENITADIKRLLPPSPDWRSCGHMAPATCQRPPRWSQGRHIALSLMGKVNR